MSPIVLLDTGPLVALLDRRDEFHRWATQQAAVLPPGFYSCEAVLSEACFLLRLVPDAQEKLMSLVQRRLIRLIFRVAEEAAQIDLLMRRYAGIPMSLADACLVRMSERVADSAVFTLDSDFRIYRRHGRQAIPLIMPPDR